MFLVYLADGLFGCAFQLEFHHVDVVRGFYHQVYASFRRVIFRLGIETYQLEDDEQHILIMQLQFAHQFVGSVGKEALQAFEEGFGLPLLNLTDKFLYLKRCLYLRETGIEGHQELDETLLYLPVGEAETVQAETFVIFLDGEIAALKDDRYRFFVAVDAVQHVGIGFLVRHAFQVVMVVSEQID